MLTLADYKTQNPEELIGKELDLNPEEYKDLWEFFLERDFPNTRFKPVKDEDLANYYSRISCFEFKDISYFIRPYFVQVKYDKTFDLKKYEEIKKAIKLQESRLSEKRLLGILKTRDSSGYCLWDWYFRLNKDQPEVIDELYQQRPEELFNPLEWAIIFHRPLSEIKPLIVSLLANDEDIDSFVKVLFTEQSEIQPLIDLSDAWLKALYLKQDEVRNYIAKYELYQTLLGEAFLKAISAGQQRVIEAITPLSSLSAVFKGKEHLWWEAILKALNYDFSIKGVEPPQEVSFTVEQEKNLWEVTHTFSEPAKNYLREKTLSITTVNELATKYWADGRGLRTVLDLISYLPGNAQEQKAAQVVDDLLKLDASFDYDSLKTLLATYKLPAKLIGKLLVKLNYSSLFLSCVQHKDLTYCETVLLSLLEYPSCLRAVGDLLVLEPLASSAESINRFVNQVAKILSVAELSSFLSHCLSPAQIGLLTQETLAAINQVIKKVPSSIPLLDALFQQAFKDNNWDVMDWLLDAIIKKGKSSLLRIMKKVGGNNLRYLIAADGLFFNLICGGKFQSSNLRTSFLNGQFTNFQIENGNIDLIFKFLCDQKDWPTIRALIARAIKPSENCLQVDFYALIIEKKADIDSFIDLFKNQPLFLKNLAVAFLKKSSQDSLKENKLDAFVLACYKACANYHYYNSQDQEAVSTAFVTGAFANNKGASFFQKLINESNDKSSLLDSIFEQALLQEKWQLISDLWPSLNRPGRVEAILGLNPTAENLIVRRLASKTCLESILDNYQVEREAMRDAKGHKQQYLSGGGLFKLVQYSLADKVGAIAALKKWLDGQPIDLKPYRGVLRNATLGNSLRAFIKAGRADILLGEGILNPPRTISDFIKQTRNHDNLVEEEEISLSPPRQP